MEHQTTGNPSEKRPHDQGLPARCRIKRRSEFLKIQNGGRKAHTSNFVVSCRDRSPQADEPSRIGITVSKRVDKRAAVRNLIKRRVREIFRTQRPIMKNNFDVVVIARQCSTSADFSTIKRELLKAFKKLGLLTQ